MHEIVVRRRWNPFGFRIGTGLFEDDLRDVRAVKKLTDPSDPFELPIGRMTAWDSLADLLPDGKAAAFQELPDIEKSGGYNRLLVKSPYVITAYAAEEPEVLASLVACLKADDPYVRIQAVAALRQLGWAEPAVVTALIEALKHDTYVRKCAAITLGQLGCAEPAVVTALIDALKDSDPASGADAAAALGQLRPRGVDGGDGFGRGMKDNDVDVRSDAARALGQFGRGADGGDSSDRCVDGQRLLVSRVRAAARHWGSW